MMVARSPRACENMVDELGEELHRQILEGERRPVKQFEHEKIGVELSEGRDRRMPEVPVSRRDHVPQGLRLDLARQKGAMIASATSA